MGQSALRTWVLCSYGDKYKKGIKSKMRWFVYCLKLSQILVLTSLPLPAAPYYRSSGHGFAWLRSQLRTYYKRAIFVHMPFNWHRNVNQRKLAQYRDPSTWVIDVYTYTRQAYFYWSQTYTLNFTLPQCVKRNILRLVRKFAFTLYSVVYCSYILV